MEKIGLSYQCEYFEYYVRYGYDLISWHCEFKHWYYDLG